MWAVQLRVPAFADQRIGDWFHHWDRTTYSDPQFGDAYHAKRYASKAGATSRAHHLRRIGYCVSVAQHPQARP